MGLAIEPRDQAPGDSPSSEDKSEQNRTIREELQRILDSRYFKHAVRSSQFLEFVVSHGLSGHGDQLKERNIGTELFHRSPGYSTGDDPVVRVQAGDVRRRLEQFYQANPNHASVRIELPVGSYLPRFVLTANEKSPSPESPAKDPVAPLRKRLRATKTGLFALGVGILVLTGFASYRISSRPAKQQSRLEQFWAPAFATPQPVLICLAKPVVYRPTLDLYRRYSDRHPGTFESEVERSNQLLPLEPQDRIAWSDITPFPDYGVAVGDAYAAVQLSALLGRIGKPSQVRIGANYSFEDLRNSPSVVVGAFNNKWTMQLSPSLHFAFVEENRQLFIREQIPNGRTWRSNFRQSQQAGDDYAIVARLLDSKTGQFTIIAAGITGSGTQTAGEFLSNPEFLEKGLRQAPPDWQKKNIEIVLQTRLTDSVAGPPRVVAIYYW